MPEYKLPDVGEGLTEAEIVSWRVKEGDVIEINDIVVEIETAKSLVELPSPYAGTVHGAAGARGRDRRRRHADHRDRRGRARRRRRRGRPASPAEAAAAAETGDRPLQPGRQRRRRGREPGRPQQGRPRADPARPQGSPSPASEAGAAPRCSSRGRSSPAARSRRGRVRRAGAAAGRSAPRRPRRPAAPRAGQAAGAQAGQGPRRRPRLVRRQRAERHRHPGGRRGRGERRRRPGRGSPARAGRAARVLAHPSSTPRSKPTASTRRRPRRGRDGKLLIKNISGIERALERAIGVEMSRLTRNMTFLGRPRRPARSSDCSGRSGASCSPSNTMSRRRT